MVINAESLGRYSTADRDPRITPIGRFIRRPRLNELTRLLNVLVGDMSITGQRPKVAAQHSLYTEEEWMIWHSVRPGTTGLAQSTMRSEVATEQRKGMDLEYPKNISFAHYARIIFKTIMEVIFNGGN